MRHLKAHLPAIDDVQDQVIRKATPDTVEQLFKLKRELIQVRRAISPVREVFNQLTNRDEKLIDPEEIVYFRDIYDHVIRLTDELDNYRELASATLDVYLTQVNNNLSVIMKRLTGVTVILAGIGAVAGIFGMSEAGARSTAARPRVLVGHRDRRWPRRRGGGRPAPDRLDLSGLGRPDLSRSRSRARRERRQGPRTSRGVSRSTSAAARTSSGIPCGPVTATARPSRAPACARRAQHREAVGVAAVVAEGHDGRRPELGQQRLEGLALATRRPRPEVDHQTAAVVREVVRRQTRCRPRRWPPRPRPARPTRSSAWRTWNATDGPLRSTNSQAGRAEDLGHARGEHLGRCQRRFVAGTERGLDAGRVAAARERAGLEAVVAEIDDAADADPGGDVGRGPTGQDRHRHAVGPCRRDAGQPAQRAASERDDRRRRRVARALGQRPVEVAHDEQPPRACAPAGRSPGWPRASAA